MGPQVGWLLQGGVQSGATALGLHVFSEFCRRRSFSVTFSFDSMLRGPASHSMTRRSLWFAEAREVTSSFKHRGVLARIFLKVKCVHQK